MTAIEAVISSANDRVPEVKGAAALDHLRVLEPDVSAVQPGEVRDALAEHDRDEADADLVHQAELLGAGRMAALPAAGESNRPRETIALGAIRPRPLVMASRFVHQVLPRVPYE